MKRLFSILCALLACGVLATAQTGRVVTNFGIVAADRKGQVSVTVTSEGLTPSTVTFNAE